MKVLNSKSNLFKMLTPHLSSWALVVNYPYWMVFKKNDVYVDITHIGSFSKDERYSLTISWHQRHNLSLPVSIICPPYNVFDVTICDAHCNQIKNVIQAINQINLI